MSPAKIKLLKKRRVFVLGAGCSYHRFKVLTYDLFDKLWKRGLKDDDELSKFLKYLYPKRLDGKIHPEEVNVEDLLSCIDAAIELEGINEKGAFGKTRLESMRKRIVAAIVALFWSENRPVDETYLAFAKQLRPSDVIVTFNYDIEVERAIAEHTGKEIPALYVRHPKPGKEHWTAVLKLHGSINLAQENGSIAWTPKPSVCSNPLIIAPTMFKRPSIVGNAWEQARLAFHSATEVWFVGYSMPQLDLPARYLLRRGVRMLLKKRPSAPIRLVDPSPDGLKRYISQIHSEIDYRRATFEEFVEKLLPQS